VSSGRSLPTPLRATREHGLEASNPCLPHRVALERAFRHFDQNTALSLLNSDRVRYLYGPPLTAHGLRAILAGLRLFRVVRIG
jgi:hypothetical protein